MPNPYKPSAVCLHTKRLFKGLQRDYMVVQREPPIIRGPFLHLQVAKKELKKVARLEILNSSIEEPTLPILCRNDVGHFQCMTINAFSTSRMIIEIINGIIQDNPTIINGQDQTQLSNGFDSFWRGWTDIRVMQHMCRENYNFIPIGSGCGTMGGAVGTWAPVVLGHVNLPLYYGFRVLDGGTHSSEFVPRPLPIGGEFTEKDKPAPEHEEDNKMHGAMSKCYCCII